MDRSTTDAPPPPQTDVNEARKANDFRLKSRFESIFEKYGKDFSAVGDEIDLKNGKIVVNNGHIQEMQGEQDTGRGLWDDFHGEDDEVLEDANAINGAEDAMVLEGGLTLPAQGHDEGEVSTTGPSGQLNSPSSPNKPPSVWDIPDADIFPPTVTPVAAAAPQYQPPRSPSPPNSGSLWAIPIPKKSRNHRTKTKRAHKTKLIRSPTKQQVPDDGAESDDPLQDRASAAASSPSSLKQIKPISPPSRVDEDTDMRSGDGPPNTDDMWVPESRPSQDDPPPSSLDASEETRQTPNPSVNIFSPLKQLSRPSVSTPGSPASRRDITSLTPDEVKRLVTLRIVERRPWSQVYTSIPLRSPGQLRYYYYVRCGGLKDNPPEGAHAWESQERDKLIQLMASPQDSWEDMQSIYENKGLEELQYQWIRACVGETDWNNWRRPHPQSNNKIRITPKRGQDRMAGVSQSKSAQGPVETSPSSNIPVTPEKIGFEPDNNRAESPDPLAEAFRASWSGSGLSAIKINTPPKRAGQWKRRESAISPLVLKSRKIQY